VPKTAAGKKQGSGKGKGKKAQPTKLLSPSSVSVNVLNGSGVPGIAGATATALGGRSFHILATASATTPTGAPDYNYTTSVIEYGGPADLAAAKTVAAQLPNVTLKQVSTGTLGAKTVTLILGSDFTKLGPAPSQPVGNLAGKFGGYQGSTNPCKGYGTAFLSAGG